MGGAAPTPCCWNCARTNTGTPAVEMLPPGTVISPQPFELRTQIFLVRVPLIPDVEVVLDCRTRR